MEKITNLQKQRAAIEQGGNANGEKTLARKRVEMLLDEGSFIETGAFVVGKNNEEAYADGVVTGYGTIGLRPVCIFSQDLAVIGGSLGEMHAQKIAKLIDFASKTGTPVVGISDTMGLRLNEGLDALDGLGQILTKLSLNSGVIPFVNVVLGNLSGIASCISTVSDFTFMVEGKSQMTMNGPMVVKGNTNIDVSELGNATFHSEESGICNFKYQDESSCLEGVKKLLEYLPDNNLSDTPYIESTDDINRISLNLNAMCENGISDVKDVIKEIVDNGEFFESQSDYAKNIVTGFAHLNGTSVGIVANNGNLNVKALKKATRFVTFCDSFNIPVITFTNAHEFDASLCQEKNSVITYASKLIMAYAEATVPKINVVLDKACGGAYLVMGSKHIGSDFTLSWAGAEISVMNSTSIANVLYDEEISNSENPQSTRDAKANEYKTMYANPFEAAKKGYVDDIVEPDSTRPVLISALEILLSKRETRPSKKHSGVNL